MKPAPSKKSRPKSGGLLRRLGRLAVILLVAGYVLAAGGGYLFLRYGRKIEEVRFTDVALFRLPAIRRTFAQQQFRQAKVAFEAKDYQQAYVYYASAVIRDPANLEGRLAAARFYQALGATNLELNLLEEGLAYNPESKELNQRLFARLLEVGRHQEVLDVLHGRHAAALAGANGQYLQIAELQATLATAGPAAARTLLERHPPLRTLPAALPVVVNVLWQSGDREAAITLLARDVETQPALPAYVLLADWLRQTGQEQPAIAVGLRAAQRFPQDPAARVLLIDLGAARLRGTPDWWREIGIYLRDFSASPKSLVLLGELAGRRGWLDLAGTLYELGARRGQDLGALGLFYSDALMQNQRVAEGRATLAQLEQQSDGRSQPFLLQLRQREITAAAAADDREGVREQARRLAGLLQNDPDLREQFRRHYLGLGLNEAVAELSERKPRAAVPPRTGGS